MNAVDGVLLCILLLSAVVGMWRGLVYEVLSVATWVVAFVLAQAYAGRAAAVLPLGEMAAGLRTAIGFAAVFIGCAFVGGMLAWLVKRMVSAVGLRPIDRVLGTAFGLLRGAVVLLAVAVVIGMTPLRGHAGWQASSVARALGESLHVLRPMLPEAVARHLS